jgi:hypothetical protein
MVKRFNLNLLKECKLLYQQYGDGDSNCFDQTLSRIILEFANNPIKVVDKVEMTLLGRGIRRVITS